MPQIYKGKFRIFFKTKKTLFIFSYLSMLVNSIVSHVCICVVQGSYIYVFILYWLIICFGTRVVIALTRNTTRLHELTTLSVYKPGTYHTVILFLLIFLSGGWNLYTQY